MTDQEMVIQLGNYIIKSSEIFPFWMMVLRKKPAHRGMHCFKQSTAKLKGLR